jgi:DNA-binding NarL/FixJ family response regulator
MPSGTSSSDLVRVLLVDDNPAMLARAAAVLASGCVVVGSATDGPSAVKAALALRPDVIVLDISMPGMSGLDVAIRLRTVGSTAPVVFLTIHDEDEIVAAAKTCGACGYVVKSRLACDLSVAVHEASAGRPFVSPLPHARHVGSVRG